MVNIVTGSATISFGSVGSAQVNPAIDELECVRIRNARKVWVPIANEAPTLAEFFA